MSEDDLADVWARSLADLAGMQIEPHQRAWLQLTRPLGLVENTALIAAPNEFVKEQLETRLRALITNALSRELARNIQLAVTVDPAATAEPSQPASHPVRRSDNADDDITGPINIGPGGLAVPRQLPNGNGHGNGYGIPVQPGPVEQPGASDRGTSRSRLWARASAARTWAAPSKPPDSTCRCRATVTTGGQAGCRRCIRPGLPTCPASRCPGPARRG